MSWLRKDHLLKKKIGEIFAWNNRVFVISSKFDCTVYFSVVQEFTQHSFQLWIMKSSWHISFPWWYRNAVNGQTRSTLYSSSLVVVVAVVAVVVVASATGRRRRMCQDGCGRVMVRVEWMGVCPMTSRTRPAWAPERPLPFSPVTRSSPTTSATTTTTTRGTTHVSRSSQDFKNL